MKNALFALSFVLFAVAAPAHAMVSATLGRITTPDGMTPEFTCYQPNLADAGVSLTLSSGGIWYHSEARIQRLSIRGAEDIGTYTVLKRLDSPNQVIFVDRKTDGRDFRLTISRTKVVRGANAVLDADTQIGHVKQSLKCDPAN